LRQKLTETLYFMVVTHIFRIGYGPVYDFLHALKKLKFSFKIDRC
jgi:hypothetical protein